MKELCIVHNSFLYDRKFLYTKTSLTSHRKIAIKYSWENMLKTACECVKMRKIMKKWRRRYEGPKCLYWK